MQTLLRERPSWRALPVALVRDARPDAPLLALNVHARREGLSERLRHGAARSLVPTLRTATAPHLDAPTHELAEALRTLSPHVEPEVDRPGVFVVDASGLQRLHRGARTWAFAVRRALAAKGFDATIAVGFDRRTTRAIALHARGVVVARTLHDERALAAEVALEVLGLQTQSLDALRSLGLRVLGDLWALPPDTVRHRFGDAVASLRAWATEEPTLPVQPDTPREPTRAVIEVEPPDDDLPRLLFALRGAAHLLVARLAATGEAVASATVTLSLDDRTQRAWRIEPASPTRDVALLIELIRLRLAESPLTAPVTEATLVAEPTPLHGEQLWLFAHDRARDRDAARRALARVRATFGDAAVTRARLRDAHLPEARFAWEPVTKLPEAHEITAVQGTPEATPLVRRLLVPPREIEPEVLRTLSPMPPGAGVLPWAHARPDNDSDGAPSWPQSTCSRVSGAWWARTVERDYFYAEGDGGALLWVFYDRVRARWFVQGVMD